MISSSSSSISGSKASSIFNSSFSISGSTVSSGIISSSTAINSSG